MKPVRRAAVVLAAVLAAWPLCIVLAQPKPPPAAEPAKPDDADSFALPTDSRLAAKLASAAEFIRDEEWGKTARVLQQLLDLDSDRMTTIGDEKHPRMVNARAEAQRLLAALPPAGRQEYQEMMGPRAAEIVKEAIKDKDGVKLTSVVRRFLFTDAGLDALEALAGLHYDAGRYRLAALSFQRLLELRDAAKASPETLFRAADAFHRVGDKADADRAAKLLMDRLGDKDLVIDGRKLSRDDVQKQLSQAVAARTDWPLFGGDASRSGQGDGAMPFLWRSWQMSTTVSFSIDAASTQSEKFGTRVADLFKRASDTLTALKQPVLPPQFPVAASVTYKKDGKKHPVVVYLTASGIAARDLAQGKLIGFAPIDGSLEWMMDPDRQNALQQWEMAYIGQAQRPGQRPGIFFENTTIGTLSIDGDFAYTVADLAVPKPPMYRMGNVVHGQPNQFGWSRDIADAISRNRLTAFDLSTGCKNLWDSNLFNPDSKDSIPELSGYFFLGPPLPLDGKLYVLSEKQQELRLIGLENVKTDMGAWKPKVDFVLPLGVSHDSNLEDDALRRINAVHLSYDDGVLVCPTNLGYVLGVDLLQHSLLWAYPYRDKTDMAGAALPPGGRVLPGGIVIGPNGQQIIPGQPQQGWKDSAPIIQDGKVVFTAPDSLALTCLDLKTGAPRWTDKRQIDDLYLAGVFDGRVLVVGTKSCRAYNLSDGKPLWSVRTGVPSGWGAAAGGVYYLPLRETDSSKAPEICAIDVAKGQIIAHARAHIPPNHEAEKQEPIGNLAFADGAVVSQTTDSITAYPLLKTKLDEMNAALAKNPGDPRGLFDRAVLRLEEGSVADAIDDLHTVIEGKPPAELLAQVREALYTGLTQLLQNDFPKGEKHLQEYDVLSHVPGDAVETHRRRAVLLLLTGRGFEGEGKLSESLSAYVELGGLGDEPLLASPDDPALRASPAALGKGAIDSLLKKAPAEKRKELEEEIRRVFDKAKESKTEDALRSFIAVVGSDADAGREARLDLAERLIEQEGRGREAEILLTAVASKGDEGQAARALEALARLSTKIGLLDDALYYYGILDREHGATKVRDGKTGAELYKELATDKRFTPLLERAHPFDGGALKATEEKGAFPIGVQRFQFPGVPEALPYFQRYRLQLLQTTADLKLVDRSTGEARWGPLHVAPTMFLSVTAAFTPRPAVPVRPPPDLPAVEPPVFAARTIGRLVVLPLGDHIFGVDAVAGKILWDADLVHGIPYVFFGSQVVNTDPRDGDLLVSCTDGWVERFGPGALVLSPSALCVMTRDGLTAVDPLTGRRLWQRSDVAPASRLFGDDMHLFVVESENGQAVRTLVLRIADGSTVPAPDFRAACDASLSASDRGLLTAAAGKDGLTLRLYDPLTGKDVWKETHPLKSIALTSLAPDLTGAVEPDGKVYVVNLRSLKEVFSGKVDAKSVRDNGLMYLLADAKHFYVVCDAPPAEGRAASDLATETGLMDLPVNGEMYAFDAATGARQWRLPVENSRLLLNDFASLPALLFAGRRSATKSLVDAAKGETTVLAVSKRTGKLLLSPDSYHGEPFHTLLVDPMQGRVELVSPKEKIVIEAKGDGPGK